MVGAGDAIVGVTVDWLVRELLFCVLVACSVATFALAFSVVSRVVAAFTFVVDCAESSDVAICLVVESSMVVITSLVVVFTSVVAVVSRL